MNVDEMDLLGPALEVTPWHPEAYDRSRAVLRAAIAESGSLPVSVSVTEPASATEVTVMRGMESSRAGNRRRGRLGTRKKVGIGAGLGSIAAAALVIAVTATPPPAPSTGTGSASQAQAVQSPLISLVSSITASSSTLPGDASLVIRTQTIGERPSEVSYNLYTDSGEFYGGDSMKTLRQAISRRENNASGITGRTVAAARYAVKGGLETARKQMVNASPNYLGLGLSAADRQKLWDRAKVEQGETYKAKGIKFPAHPPTGKRLQALTGNHIWNNGIEAMTAGGGDPQVRAGVLRLLSTVPEVTVKKSTTGGQATLTLTAGSALFLGGSPQVLTINAETGMPIKSAFAAADDLPSSVSTFKVSRLTLDSIKTGTS
jgi:hypothetical protein